MDIIDLRPSELVPYESNPRNNAEAVDKVAASIREFGFKVPIVVDAANVIIAGHTRWLAAQKLGLETVPCLRADDLTPEQVRAFRLADNKVGEFASWDKALLREELRALEGLSLDMADFGFEIKDIKEVKEYEYAPWLPEVPVSKPGDLWQLGDHLLFCGDATQEASYKALMRDRLADIILTDPPYGVNYSGWAFGKTKAIKNDAMSSDQFCAFLSSFYAEAFRAIKDGACIYSFCADRFLPEFRKAFGASGFIYNQLLIWVKNAPMLGRCKYHYMYEPIIFGHKGERIARWFGNRKQKTVIESVDLMDEFQLRQFVKDQWEGTDIIRAKKPAASKLHPTMKPIKLLEVLLRNSTAEGDVVLDPFGGSGSTLIACEQMGRRCYMMELEPAYCDVIIDRWEKFTGGKAQKLDI